jgi:hypothetical protein
MAYRDSFRVVYMRAPASSPSLAVADQSQVEAMSEDHKAAQGAHGGAILLLPTNGVGRPADC